MSDNRPIVYREGDVWVYRASSIGLPVRCLAAARQGYDPLPSPQHLLAAAAEGNRLEPVVKERLQKEGFRIGVEQQEVELQVEGAAAILRGHLDGADVSTPDGRDGLILEVKTMSRRVWDKFWRYRWDRAVTYAWQLSVYMHAVGAEAAVYAVLNRDTDQLQTFIVEEPPVRWSQIEAKVLAVEAFGERSDLPPCTGAEYECSWSYLCDRQAAQFVELESGDAELIASLAARYTQLSEAIKELNGLKGQVRDELVVALEAAGGKVETAGWRVQMVERTNTSLDRDALRRELGDRFDEFTKRSTSRYPRVDWVGE